MFQAKQIFDLNLQKKSSLDCLTGFFRLWMRKSFLEDFLRFSQLQAPKAVCSVLFDDASFVIFITK